MDSIFISELKIETRIGIYDWEKKVPQTIQLDIEVDRKSTRLNSSHT